MTKNPTCVSIHGAQGVIDRLQRQVRMQMVSYTEAHLMRLNVCQVSAINYVRCCARALIVTPVVNYVSVTQRSDNLSGNKRILEYIR
jgi:hypothetical protein